MDKKGDDQENESHDEGCARPARYLKALLSNEGLHISCHLLLLFGRCAELSECVHQVHIAVLQSLISHCRLQEAAEWLRIVLNQLLLNRLVLLITVDLEAECEQNVFKQFDLGVDPLEHDADLAGALGLQVIEFILA